MCRGLPYHIVGKKEHDYQNSWYICERCGNTIGRQPMPFLRCSVCGGKLINYICTKCDCDWTIAFSVPVDFDAIL